MNMKKSKSGNKKIKDLAPKATSASKVRGGLALQKPDVDVRAPGPTPPPRNLD